MEILHNNQQGCLEEVSGGCNERLTGSTWLVRLSDQASLNLFRFKTFEYTVGSWFMVLGMHLGENLVASTLPNLLGFLDAPMAPPSHSRTEIDDIQLGIK